MSTAQHRTYVEFLDFFHQWKRILGPVDVDGQFGRLAEQIASMHPEIGAPPDPAERLEAARRVLFGEADSTPVVRLDRRCEFSLHSCPLGPASLEFRDMCRFARMVLIELVGDAVEQTERARRPTLHVSDPGWARIVKYSIGRMVQPAACP